MFLKIFSLMEITPMTVNSLCLPGKWKTCLVCQNIWHWTQILLSDDRIKFQYAQSLTFSSIFLFHLLISFYFKTKHVCDGFYLTLKQLNCNISTSSEVRVGSPLVRQFKPKLAGFAATHNHVDFAGSFHNTGRRAITDIMLKITIFEQKC